jgi:hypothetical protein
MWAMGFWSQLQAAQYADPSLVAVHEARDPPQAPAAGPVGLGPAG